MNLRSPVVVNKSMAFMATKAQKRNDLTKGLPRSVNERGFGGWRVMGKPRLFHSQATEPATVRQILDPIGEPSPRGQA